MEELNKEVANVSPAVLPVHKANVKQEQIHNILFSKEIGWQEIIHDLINTDQLDPWDIDIIILADGFIKRMQDLEEADFFISGKVLLAASLLLRIKSEILLNKYIKSIDDILFGKKEEKKYVMERIDLDEEIPELIPKSPIPRFKRVTLQELLSSLDKAITTENRRIKKEIVNKNALREVGISLTNRTYNIKDKIREIYQKTFGHFEKNKDKIKVSYTELIGLSGEERRIAFPPLLHLDHQQKIWLEQEKHFDEIHIWLKHIYLQHNPNPTEVVRLEVEKQIEEFNSKQKRRIDKIEGEFENPMREYLEEVEEDYENDEEAKDKGFEEFDDELSENIND